MRKREEILELLQKHSKVNLVFTKANGKTRKMIATRNPEIIFKIKGSINVSKTNSKRKIDEEHNNITVFDLQKQDFRSFKVDRLLSLEISK